jgi:hypothetical protein
MVWEPQKKELYLYLSSITAKDVYSIKAKGSKIKLYDSKKNPILSHPVILDGKLGDRNRKV